MKKIIKSIILTFFVIDNISAQLDNNESMEKAGTAAAQFLKIPFDSKGSAMGNTGVSMPGTIGSSYWNPATIAAVEQNEFGILSAKWLADINIDFFGFILATKKFGNIGFNVFSLNTPEDDVTTIYQPDGTGEKWKASDISISISYGRKLSNNFSIGSNLKFIQQKIWHTSAYTLAGDIGVLFITPFKNARLGASLSNYGGKMKLIGRDQKLSIDPDPINQGNVEFVNGSYETNHFDLPLLFRVGISNEVIKAKYTEITYSMDAIYPSDGVKYLGIGIEANLLNQYKLRIGIPSFTNDNSVANVTLGLGVDKFLKNTKSRVGFDYSLIDFGPLGVVQKIYLNFNY